jgi:hypothetical protein
MALLDRPDFYGDTVFCDDIRHEVGGKVSYIGSYQGSMFISAAFPITLPKFGFAITFLQKRTNFEPNLGVRIFMPGDSDDAPSIQADLIEQGQGTIAAETRAQSRHLLTEHSMIALRSNLLFSPLIISRPGIIQVRILRRGDLVRLGDLSVELAPTA